MRNSRGGPLKLIGTLRGEGRLARGAAAGPVRYQVDIYRRGAGMLVGGEVEGKLARLRGESGQARLTLADGAEIVVDLRDVGSDLAAFDGDEIAARAAHTIMTAPAGG